MTEKKKGLNDVPELKTRKQYRDWKDCLWSALKGRESVHYVEYAVHDVALLESRPKQDPKLPLLGVIPFFSVILVTIVVSLHSDLSQLIPCSQ